MINFLIEPGYEVKKPEREFGNAGIDFFIPEYTETFIRDFEQKNLRENASLLTYPDGVTVIRIEPHGRVNIPSGIRSRFGINIALEAHNKSGIATKLGLVFGASTVDASYQGIIHISLINTTNTTIEIPLGMKVVQFIPRLIDISDIVVYDDMSFDEFYRDFEHTNRGEGCFGSTGV